MIEYKEEKKRIFFEGVEVASFLARYPVTKDFDKINAFIFELVTNSLTFFIDTLCERAREEYTNDASETKRFYFKPYRYILDIRGEEGDNELKIALEATLFREKKDKLSDFSDTFEFDTKRQIIKAPQKKKKRKK